MTVQTAELKIGDLAPDFCLPDKDNKEACLRDFKGIWVVLYFYPRDNTSGCTREAADFTDALDEFEKLNAIVLGVNADSVESHSKFAGKYNLKVTLLSDGEQAVLKKFGVWQLKKLYGREFWGVVRSTFLIDPAGKIAYVWPRVKVKGHVEAVKRKLMELQ
ncbi:MAG: peroxiredoxin [Methanomicrobia archaeon]|nr:peroxiredoxin [Methanomicrobia archaeon]